MRTTAICLFLLLFTATILQAQDFTWKGLREGGGHYEKLYAMTTIPGGGAIACGENYRSSVNGVIVRENPADGSWGAIEFGTKSLHGIHFPTPDTGFICGWNRTLLMTVDGGTEWIDISAGIPTWFPGELYGIRFFDADTGIVVGRYQMIHRTVDGGATWEDVKSGNPTLRAVAITGDSIAVVVGSSGTILRSVDFGATWNSITSGVTAAIYDVAYIGGTVFIAVGYSSSFGAAGVIIRSDDLGETWSTPTATGEIGYYELHGLAVSGSDTVLAFGQNTAAGASGRIVLASHDAGDTWSVLFADTSNHALYTGLIVSADRYFATGTGGDIFVYDTSTIETGILTASAPTGQGFLIHKTDAGLRISNSSGGPAHLTIYSLTGRVLKKITRIVEPTFTVDHRSSGIPAGTYLFSITAPDFRTASQIVFH